MFCGHCGAKMNPGEQFCGTCGKKVGVLPNQPSNYGTKTVFIAQGGAVTDKTESVYSVRPNTGAEKSADILQVSEEVKQIWPDWEIVSNIGEGSFGKVYKAKRTELGTEFFSAIKIIRIPQSKSETDTVRSEIGLDEQSTTAYFRGFVDECVNEIKVMESLKGTQNIVSVEDYKVIPNEDEIGWTIFIRMELLTSFVAYTKDRILSEAEVIKLGIDICNALEFCGKLNVMHRDIKPENIFVSSFGIYKLGDFGIARKLEKATVGLSKKGTYNYMAPEVYNGSTSYDFTSDIYSLGIVLYKLLNNNRLPLLDPAAGSITYPQMQTAFEQRIRGATLPKPCNASPALSGVILTACAYDPSRRFPNASAFKTALTRVMNGETDINTILDGTVSVFNAAKAQTIPKAAEASKAAPATSEQKRASEPKKAPTPKAPKEPKKKMKKGKKIFICVTAAILVLAIAAGAFYLYRYFSPEQKMLRALEEENYEEAIEIFNEDLHGEGGEALVNALTERLNAVKTDFENQTIDYITATAELDNIQGMNVQEVSALLTETRQFVVRLNDSRTAFSTAETMMKEGDYEGAIAQYKLVQDIDVNYAAAMTQMEAAADNYRDEVLAAADTYASNGLYEDAIDQLNIGLSVLPEDAKLVEQIRIYEDAWAAQSKADMLQKAEDYVTAGDYPSAIKLLAGNESDAEINTAHKKYCKAYEDQLLADADALVAEKDFDGAISLLNNGMKVLKSNDNLTAKLSEIEASRPISLTTLKAINSENWDTWNKGSPTDPFDNDYSTACNFAILSNGNYRYGYYTEYRLYGKYSQLTGTLAPYTSISEDGYCYIQVYADDVLVYTSPNVTRKTDAFDFSVDVSGAEYVKISVYAEWYSSIIISDVKLWP